MSFSFSSNVNKKQQPRIKKEYELEENKVKEKEGNQEQCGEENENYARGPVSVEQIQCSTNKYTFRNFDPSRCNTYHHSTLRAFARHNSITLPETKITQPQLCFLLKSEWERRNQKHSLVDILDKQMNQYRKEQNESNQIKQEKEHQHQQQQKKQKELIKTKIDSHYNYNPVITASTFVSSSLSTPSTLSTSLSLPLSLISTPVSQNRELEQKQVEDKNLNNRIKILENTITQLQQNKQNIDRQNDSLYAALQAIIIENQSKQITLAQMEEAVTRLAEKQRHYGDISANSDLKQAKIIENHIQRLQLAIDVLQNLSSILKPYRLLVSNQNSTNSTNSNNSTFKSNKESQDNNDNNSNPNLTVIPNVIDDYSESLRKNLENARQELLSLPQELRQHASEQARIWDTAAASGLVRQSLPPY